MRVPDHFEAITAYRAWGVWDNGLLTGQAHPEVWPPYQTLQARCSHIGKSSSAGAHIRDGVFLDAPIQLCSCGIYSLKDREAAECRTAMVMHFSLMDGRPQVWGKIRIWGRVIEHEAGYRSEFAYPEEIYCSVSLELADTISVLYGIPVHYQKPSFSWDDGSDGHSFWRLLNSRTPGYATYTPRRLGVITSLVSDIDDKPHIIKPAEPNVVQPHIVKAS